MENPILSLLAKLKLKAESCAAIGNQEEAELFAAKVQELLLKHKLTMSDVEEAAQEKDDPIAKEIHPPQTKGMKWFVLDLAGIIAEAHFCKRYENLATKGAVSFVGRKSDREVAIYMYVYLLRAMQQLEKEAHLALKKERAIRIRAILAALESNSTPPEFDEPLGTTEFTDAFYRGFIKAIKDRYEAQKLAGIKLYGEAGLVRANTAVSNWVNQNMRLSSSMGQQGGGEANAIGQRAGYAQGSKIDISRRGVTGGGSKGRLIS